MLGVWLAKGGRKILKATRIQLIIHSTKHGTNLTLIELDKVSIFQTMSKAKHTKFLVTKTGSNFEKVSCIV